MSVDDPSEDRECPLCMEKLEIDDLHFYPCVCKYQVCRFCWHRIRTDENGLCPACRTPYPEDPVNFQPLTPSEMQQLRTEKKQKEKKRNVSENRKHLAAYRVLQQNLVYVLGLSPRIADPEILKSSSYFGKFGKVQKVAVGTLPSSTGNTPIYTAYVTFNRVEDALKTILETNSIVFDGRVIKTSLGTTKYCSNFLRGMTCHKQECMYLHEVAPTELSFTKEDMHQGKHTEYERRMIEKLSRKTPEEKNKILGYSDVGSSVPSSQPEERNSPLVPEFEEEESDDAKSSSGVSRQNSDGSDLNDFQADAVYDYRAPAAAVEEHSTEKSAMPFSSQSSSEKTLVAPSSSVLNEDELGFDPLAESLKGLAELLQQEEQKQIKTTAPFDLFSLETGATKDFSRLSMNHRQPFDYYANSHDYSSLQRDSATGSMLPPCNNGVFGNFQNGYRSQQQNDFDFVRESNYYNQLPGDYFSYRPEQNFSFSRQDPSRNVSSYGGMNPNPNSMPTPSQNIHETRDAFKALLPNVNVSFVSSAAEMRSLLSSSPSHFGQASNSYTQESYRGFPDLGYQQNTRSTSYNGEIGRQNSNTSSSSKWMVSPPPGFDSSGRNQGQG
uniref:CCR4-NOT transcription complex subunit 4 n=1 Tax=Panagrolaimus sp. JU765 TaxID=591449 RepID=A0AC34PUC8_9BILA